MELYGVRIDSITLERAVEQALDERERQAFVVTPNAQMLSACKKDALYGLPLCHIRVAPEIP